MFFFFKQKTAYEMRISDWSSDVCSSDLRVGDERDHHVAADLVAALDKAFDRHAGIAHRRRDFGEHADAVLDDQPDIMFADARAGVGGWRLELGRASWRDRVCQHV